MVKGNKCTVGVCTTSVPDTGYVNKTKHGWGYYQANGKIGHAGPANIRFGEGFRTSGDIIEVSRVRRLGFSVWCRVAFD